MLSMSCSVRQAVNDCKAANHRSIEMIISVMIESYRLIANRKENDDNMQMSASVIVHISSAYNASQLPLMGLEPTIFELEVQRLIHWATGA